MMRGKKMAVACANLIRMTTYGTPISMSLTGELDRLNDHPSHHLAPGNLLTASLSEILAGFDRDRIATCSGKSSCNRLDSRIMGLIVRHPLTALCTPVMV
jgi:hypothetical protein